LILSELCAGGLVEHCFTIFIFQVVHNSNIFKI
jgi:hypothetical protein